ncbi:MAG: tRNA guanosine(34) transglycosylase Tgt [Candidatus Absconditabacterales bacterium]|nr:tRNA guanosine(34) transglycosylase Tgt [Candidatus Absconditabacterales bacterium]
MSKLKFKILKQRGNARVGEIELNGIKLTTPVFMPVGTKATIKGLFLDVLKNEKILGNLDPIKLILANTFHLYLRPGDELIKKAGGLHKFENWEDGLILTDSGGFQVFSLGLGKDENRDKGAHKVDIKLVEDGVHFRSPYDGSKHFFSPEKVVDIQCNLGSDIMMVLDVCSPGNSDKETLYSQMQQTHRWAKRAYDHFMKKYDKVKGVLFPIVQGGTDLEMRKESAEYLSQFATDGIAIGGVSVGESKEKVREVVEFTTPLLPNDKPRYLMGVGTPEDLLHAIEHGVDMFDCVLATRLGRHGVAFSGKGNINLNNAKFKEDFNPLDDTAEGLKNYSKSYIHHLLKEKEMLGGIILSLHNILYLHKILENWKRNFLED